HREVDAEQEMCSNPAEGRVRLLEIAEHRVAEYFVAIARLIARIAAVLRSGSREVDQPVRLRHRQRLEKDFIEQGVDRRIRADPEREGKYRDDRNERRFEQRSKRQLEIPHFLGEA